MAQKEAGEHVAELYARALLDVAAAEQAVERTADELRAVRAVLRQDVRLARFLASPVIGFPAKRDCLTRALENPHRLTLNFLLVLLKRGRLHLLGRILEAYRTFSLERQGVVELQVASAQALEAGERKGLTDMLARRLGRKVELTEEVRPELLGGLVLRHGRRRWDASLEHTLEELTERLREARPGKSLWAE